MPETGTLICYGLVGLLFAAASGLSRSTIGAFEAKDEDARLTTMNNKAAVEAFEAAGLEFIPEDGGGAGIRFRERKA